MKTFELKNKSGHEDIRAKKSVWPWKHSSYIKFWLAKHILVKEKDYSLENILAKKHFILWNHKWLIVYDKIAFFFFCRL